MRSILKTTFVALLAVLALGAVAASSALASPAWYVKKGGTWTKASTAVKVEFEASKLAMIDNEGGVYKGLSCTGHFGAGVVGSSGLTIEKFEPGRAKEQCKGGKIKENTETNACEKEGIETTKIGYAPWTTALSTEGTTIRASISGSFGIPEMTVVCKVAGVKRQFSCDINTSAHMIDNATSLTVEAEFEAKSKRTECINGKEAGEWKGILKIAPSTAEKTAGVEGVKVE
jgi:hypothetical protein